MSQELGSGWVKGRRSDWLGGGFSLVLWCFGGGGRRIEGVGAVKGSGEDGLGSLRSLWRAAKTGTDPERRREN